MQSLADGDGGVNKKSFGENLYIKYMSIKLRKKSTVHYNSKHVSPRLLFIFNFLIDPNTQSHIDITYFVIRVYHIVLYLTASCTILTAALIMVSCK